MTITVLLDPSQMPDQSQDQLDFDNKMSGLMRDLPTFAAQMNAIETSLSSMAAGGAYALPYVFDTATADADPGAGKLRLSNATQSAATVMRLDLTAGGQDYTTLLDTMDSSTSVIKGSIRLVKQGDLSKWMTFDVTARAAPVGYRNLAVVCTDSSSASPFVKDDPLLLFFQRSGDKGEIGASGMVPLASVTISSPVASIDYLNIFSPLYDKYTIEIQGLTKTGSTNSNSLLQLAFGGVVNSSSYSSTSVPTGSSSTAGLIIGSDAQLTTTAEIRNANGAYKTMVADGFPVGFRIFGAYINVAAPASGFRLTPDSGNFAAGIIRVYGHRNNP